MALEKNTTDKVTAKELLHEVQRYTFIGFIHNMVNVLHFLGKTFQQENVHFSLTVQIVENVIDILVNLYDIYGSLLQL